MSSTCYRKIPSSIGRRRSRITTAPHYGERTAVAPVYLDENRRTRQANKTDLCGPAVDSDTIGLISGLQDRLCILDKFWVGGKSQHRRVSSMGRKYRAAI